MADEFTDNLALTKIGRRKAWAEAMNENLDKIGALHYIHTNGSMHICKNAVYRDGAWIQPDTSKNSSIILLGEDSSFVLFTCAAGNHNISLTTTATFGSDGTLTIPRGGISTSGSALISGGASISGATSVGNDLTVTGNIYATGNVSDGGGIVIPSGVIAMWSGSIANIPSGWTLCNGENGTPNLRDKFVVGVGNNYTVGETGGENEHTLTIDEIPSHDHTFSCKGSPGGTYSTVDTLVNQLTTTTRTTSAVGGGEPHNNLPPYYALCYIMKL